MTNAIGSEVNAGCTPEGARDSEGPGGGPVGALAAIAAAVQPVVRSAASLLAEIFDRIVHGIRCMAPLVLSIGCQAASDVVDVAPPALEPVPGATVPKAEDSGPRQLGQFTITFYYVIGEDEVAAKPPLVVANENHENQGDGDSEFAAVAPDLVKLYAGGGKCDPIAEVSKDFATQLVVQGTGKLHDGRVLNIWGACNCKRSPCFKVTQAQWGTAGSGKPLQPFRTMAVDPKVVKLGSLLYVPLLEGRMMPGRQPWGGYVHDGCVVADDTGGHISGNRLDLFVGRKAYFLGLSGSGGSHAWARHVPVYDGTGICERKGRQVGRKAASI